MDHGRLFSTSNPTLNQETNLRGIQLSAALNQVSQEDLNKFSNVREFEIAALDGRAMLIAKNGQTSELLFTESNSSPNQEYLISTARSAVSRWPETAIKSSYMVAADDVYGHLREGSFPKKTLRIILDDVDETWVHINLDDGHIVSVMDKSRRLYRWLFNGIHSLDLPGFSSTRPLWDIFMVVLMLTGTIFSITGLILAYKKLVRPITNYVKVKAFRNTLKPESSIQEPKLRPVLKEGLGDYAACLCVSNTFTLHNDQESTLFIWGLTARVLFIEKSPMTLSCFALIWISKRILQKAED